ncbi:MAG TPA: hypothetical protein PL074_05670 [Thermoflexales bacterium]|nr:hypothetical protein [Thermoflexales bacterium]
MSNGERGISRAFSALWGGVMIAGLVAVAIVAVNAVVKIAEFVTYLAREVLK